MKGIFIAAIAIVAPLTANAEPQLLKFGNAGIP